MGTWIGWRRKKPRLFMGDAIGILNHKLSAASVHTEWLNSPAAFHAAID